jgi:hypothetical protein
VAGGGAVIELYGGGDRARDQQARQWRSDRIKRFTEKQHKLREWINFAEIADLCSELDGLVVPNEAARASAYEKLQRALLEGDFEEGGRSRVLYLHASTKMAKMTRKGMRFAIDRYPPEIIRSEYLDHCWVRRNLFQRWALKHHLPHSPPRFEPIAQAITRQPALSAAAGRATKDSAQRRRGPPPKKLELVKKAMRDDIQSGQQTIDTLRCMLEKNLAKRYRSSRDTARKARSAVLLEFVGNSNSDK